MTGRDDQGEREAPRDPDPAALRDLSDRAALRDLADRYARWYGKLLPRIVFDGYATNRNNTSTMQDYTLPIDLRYARAQNADEMEFQVMAVWDLSSFVFGDTNVSNPDLIIESTLRMNRERLLAEVRTRYREAALVAKQLEAPSTDPKTTFMWRSRLAEHTSYLRFVTGREVLKTPLQELSP